MTPASEPGDHGPHVTRSGEETIAFGENFASKLKRGDIVAINGDLGTGKTTLVKGICRGLGVTEPVTSPTFTIGQVYEGRDPDGDGVLVSHLDLYRLAGLEEEDPALLEDYLGPDRIAILEWPQVALGSLADRITWQIALEYLGADERRITVDRR